MKVRVSEIFYSISGEGISTGIPTVFVRLAGCSLRCGKTKNSSLWCDTPYALNPNKGEYLSVAEVLQKIQGFTLQPEQILLTGGEPLENEKKTFCKELVKKISTKRHNKKPVIRIETNGKESIDAMDFVVFSMDYKLPGSGMESFMNLENFTILRERKNPLDEVKFVVRDRLDFQRSLEVIRQCKFLGNKIYSPVFPECDPKELAEWLKTTPTPNSRLSLQIHKILWGSKKGV